MENNRPVGADIVVAVAVSVVEDNEGECWPRYLPILDVDVDVAVQVEYLIAALVLAVCSYGTWIIQIMFFFIT